MKIAAKAEKVAKTAKAKPAKKAAKEEKGQTLRGHVFERLAAGDTNQEIIDGLTKAGFELDSQKKGYIAWYRWDAVRKGVITKKFADAHAGDRVKAEAKPAKKAAKAKKA